MAPMTSTRKRTPTKPAPISSPSSRPTPVEPVAEHLTDLRRLQRLQGVGALQAGQRNLHFWAKRSVVVSFVSFVLTNILTYLRTLLLAPATALSDPVGTVVALGVHPLMWIGLGIVVFIFWIATLLRGDLLIDKLSRMYGGGWSMVNWPNPQIFGESSKRAVEDAKPYLTGEIATTEPQQVDLTVANPDFTSLKTARVFSLPLARALLLMSALVYERSDKLVAEAAKTSFRASLKYKANSEAYKSEMKRAEETLIEAERLIKDKAASWGLEFDGVSDLSTVAGPFASIFYTPFSQSGSEKPFIALIFKGTGPSNFSEFLIDATISRVSASVYFGPGSGSVHQGFYSDLFPVNEGSAPTAGDGYGNIVRTLRHTAARMAENFPGVDLKIPLWVAGHSLGSTLASLCFARFLRAPNDLGPHLKLRDCYSYGTPRLGDGNFASAFEQTLITPLDRPSILWRIANHRDVVTKVPYGLADKGGNRSSLPSLSILNYAFLGPAIRLKPASWPHSLPFWEIEQLGAFHEQTEVRVVDHEPRFEGHPEATNVENWAGWKKRSARWRSVEGAGGKNPVRWAMATLLPSFVYDHFPNSYYQHLNNLETTDELVAREREEARVQATATGALLPGPLSRFIERVNEWMQEIGGDAQRMKEEVLAVGGKV